jgi:hypothetical protein
MAMTDMAATLMVVTDCRGSDFRGIVIVHESVSIYGGTEVLTRGVLAYNYKL